MLREWCDISKQLYTVGLNKQFKGYERIGGNEGRGIYIKVLVNCKKAHYNTQTELNTEGWKILNC